MYHWEKKNMLLQNIYNSYCTYSIYDFITFYITVTLLVLHKEISFLLYLLSVFLIVDKWYLLPF